MWGQSLSHTPLGLGITGVRAVGDRIPLPPFSLRSRGHFVSRSPYQGGDSVRVSRLQDPSCWGGRPRIASNRSLTRAEHVMRPWNETGVCMGKPRVLFLCAGNSARSQMAEAFLRTLAPERFEAFSGGLKAHGVHPRVVRSRCGYGSGL